MCPDRAAAWRDLLLVADVHLGKGDHFRARGLPLPPGELAEDLERLARLVAETGARRLVVLGDLVHGRVSAATAALVADWRAGLGCALQLVPGNHDRHQAELPAAWGVEVLAPVYVEPPFTFVHAPTAGAGRYQWAGHVHPTATFAGGGDRLRFPCFVVGAEVALLPAFSRFTGGPGMRPEPGRVRYACVGAEVVAMD